MAVLVGKAIDLVFHARAIARPDAFDLAGEHRAAIETGADDLVRARIGVGDPARHLRRMHGGGAHEAENRHGRRGATGHAIAGLLDAAREVDAAAIESRRRAGLQSRLRQLQFLQACRQGDRRRITRPTGLVVVQPDVDASVEEGARREHHRAGSEGDADLRHGTHHAIAFDHEIVHRLLEQAQAGLVLQASTDGGLVEHPVGLRARRPHGRSLAGIQDAELDAGLVRRQGHGTPERIDLAHQVALADATDGGIAAHLPQGFDVVGEQQGLGTHAGGRQCRLGAGMAATDDDDVEFFGIKHVEGAHYRVRGGGVSVGDGVGILSARPHGHAV